MTEVLFEVNDIDDGGHEVANPACCLVCGHDGLLRLTPQSIDGSYIPECAKCFEPFVAWEERKAA